MNAWDSTSSEPEPYAWVFASALLMGPRPALGAPPELARATTDAFEPVAELLAIAVPWTRPLPP
jgi:hypothetical protein